jgi:hypothetical protein
MNEGKRLRITLYLKPNDERFVIEEAAHWGANDVIFKAVFADGTERYWWRDTIHYFDVQQVDARN